MLVIENPKQLSITSRAMLHHVRAIRGRQSYDVPSKVLSDSQLGTLCQIIYRRHASQILQRSHADRRASDHLAACGYVPADGALTFDSPIVPMGDAIMLLLHWQAVTSTSGTRHACRVRGYTSWFASHKALTFWDGQVYSFAVNFSQPNCWKALDRALPAHGLAAARVAMDMESEIHRLTPRIDGIDAEPKLPGTLMAIPRSAQIEAEPTPTVVDHAAKTGLSWRAAWEHLYASWAVPDALNPLASTCQLVNTQLCTRARRSGAWPGKVALFHDMREIVGRAVPNPSQRIGCNQCLPTETLIEQTRAEMSPDISASCSNKQLLEALSTPRLPLSLPGLSKCQIWAPAPSGPRAEAFRFKTTTSDADLWSIAEG